MICPNTTCGYNIPVRMTQVCPGCELPIENVESADEMERIVLPQDREKFDVIPEKTGEELVNIPSLLPQPRTQTAAERVAQIYKERGFTGYEHYEGPIYK